MTKQKNIWDLQSYEYDLPENLIATRPAQRRDQSRLLVFDERCNGIYHKKFSDLKHLLPEKSHLVLNNSKVYPCRLLGEKDTGGKCEIFLLSLGEPYEGDTYYECMIKSRGKKSLGQSFLFTDGLKATIKAINEDGTFKVSFNTDHEKVMNYLDHKALIPLPPYIRGGVSDERDRGDYQTVYAKNLGSVAAPTAGLHFTKKMLQGFSHSFVNLHVGLGTFKPVSSQDIREHDIHSEIYSVEKEELKKINDHKKQLFAVGTTSLRVLESSYEPLNKEFLASDKKNETNIFLYPGKPIHSIKGLITNFHLPGSSLIMLVSALIGLEKTMELYKLAIKHQYRFYSYGDAMLIIRKDHV